MKLSMSLCLALVLAMSSSAVFAAGAAKCKNFNTQPEAQDYFKKKGKGWKRLDGDKDGEACECLKGGSSYGDNRCHKWRKKHGKK